MTHPVDDLTFIQRFITGKSDFESNQHLRVQSANRDRQLLAHAGQFLAVAHDHETPAVIEVRPGTEYEDMLHRLLLEQHYIPTGTDDDHDLKRYCYHRVPEHYQVRCGPARDLWRQWWVRRKQLVKYSFQMDLLVWRRHQWYPIRDCSFSNNILYVETLVGETRHLSDDVVVWLEQEKAGAESDSGQDRSKSQTAPEITAAGRGIREVAFYKQGKLYIHTTVGIVVVEGKELKCYRATERASI